MQPYLINPRTCIVRHTDRARGRSRTVAPGITAARYLHYGRIILEGKSQPRREFGSWS